GTQEVRPAQGAQTSTILQTLISILIGRRRTSRLLRLQQTRYGRKLCYFLPSAVGARAGRKSWSRTCSGVHGQSLGKSLSQSLFASRISVPASLRAGAYALTIKPGSSFLSILDSSRIVFNSARAATKLLCQLCSDLRILE